MKLLYVATDQEVPGSTGGSVHVEEVARGLARRGHEVHVVARGMGGGELRVHPPPRLAAHRMLRWTGVKAVGQLIDGLGIDVVLERYYNFAGEGVRAAHARGLPSVLEVNSPVMDHPGSVKALIDRALVFRPMRRLREELCRKATALVTPLPSIVPSTVPPDKVHQIHWGANVERFRPGLAPTGRALELPIPPDARVVVFSGSFRRWHGAELLVRAGARVLRETESRNAFFLFLGGGPDLPRVERAVARFGLGSRAHVAGRVAYEHMPQCLARCHIGVAPYEPARHGQLQLGFYWSPLKIFEYMASGLPVVTLDIDPLREMVRQEQEGLLFEEGDEAGLAQAISRLVRSPEPCAEMGRRARDRVVSRYSWQLHCERLDQVIEAAVRGP